MVAQTLLPPRVSPSLRRLTAEPRPTPPIPPAPRTSAIKVLNLLSNRYHGGIVRSAADGKYALELPLTSHLHAGQRVRFILEEEAGEAVVARHHMRGALVTRVAPTPTGAGLEVELATAADFACV